MRRALATCTMLVTAALATGASAVTQSQPPDPPRAAVAPQADAAAPAGIANFSRVEPTVACGGATDPNAFAILAAQGYHTVINLRLPAEPGVAEEQQVVEDAGLRYLHLPLDPGAPDPAVAERFLEVIADPSIAPVYIHCASANRVGAMWAIKRVVLDGWTRAQAREEAEAIGMKSPAMAAYVDRVLDGRQ